MSWRVFFGGKFLTCACEPRCHQYAFGFFSQASHTACHDASLVGGTFTTIREVNSAANRPRLATVSTSSAFGRATTLYRFRGYESFSSDKSVVRIVASDSRSTG